MSFVSLKTMLYLSTTCIFNRMAPPAYEKSVLWFHEMCLKCDKVYSNILTIQTLKDNSTAAISQIQIQITGMISRLHANIDLTYFWRHWNQKKVKYCFLSHFLFFLVAVVTAFFVCWAPFHAQRLLAVYLSSAPEEAQDALFDFYRYLMYTSGMLYFVSTTINPVLYHIMSRKFRKAFKVIVFYSLYMFYHIRIICIPVYNLKLVVLIFRCLKIHSLVEKDRYIQTWKWYQVQLVFHNTCIYIYLLMQRFIPCSIITGTTLKVVSFWKIRFKYMKILPNHHGNFIFEPLGQFLNYSN